MGMGIGGGGYELFLFLFLAEVRVYIPYHTIRMPSTLAYIRSSMIDT